MHDTGDELIDGSNNGKDVSEEVDYEVYNQPLRIHNSALGVESPSLPMACSYRQKLSHLHG